jgi:hypothetical protein
MTDITCRHEHAVRSALAGDSWTAELLEHVAGCTTCADLMLVETFMRHHAGEVVTGVSVPDSAFVWWRAQLEARSADAQRATRIITVVQRVAIACSGLVGALGAVRYWPQLKSTVASLVPASIPSSLPSDMAPPGLVMLASLAVVAVLLVYDLREPRTGD